LVGERTGRNGGVGYAVQTAVNGGSRLWIFVRRAAHSQITLNDLGEDDIDE
jgi:hypothetical protein